MTIARHRTARFNAIAAPMPTAPSVRSPVPGVDAPVLPGDAPTPEATTPVGRLRRCTFRRVDLVSPVPGRPELTTYEMVCLFGDRDAPVALGDIDEARQVCDGCTSSGIFRADED